MRKVLIYVVTFLVIFSNVNISVFAQSTEDGENLLQDPIVTEFENGDLHYEIGLSDETSITNARYKLWTTENGQDDLEENVLNIVNGTLSLDIKKENHSNEIGEYNLSFVLTDITGNDSEINVDPIVILDQEVVTEESTVSENSAEPLRIAEDENVSSQSSGIISIKNVNIKKESSGRYQIHANVNASNGISQILFATWTQSRGQDDLIWGQGTVSGNSVSYTVDIKNHNYEDGIYISHMYVYDSIGNKESIAVPNQSIKNNAPTIKDIKVSKSSGKYTITAKVEDDYALDSVLFPTWTTKNGQDDLVWGTGIVNGNTVTYTVDIKDHKYESGSYNTHIYAYDKSGKRTVEAVAPQNVTVTAPIIDNVKVSTQSGKYTISATINGGYGIEQVLFPTWTSSNGQDDLTWGQGTVTGNTVTYTVDIKNHKNEVGNYNTHIYAYDKLGNCTVYVLPIQKVSINPLKISDVNVTQGAGEYTITGKISGGYGNKSTEFPTWTSANGQDDIIWGKGNVNGDTFTYTVSTNDHKGESGSYITHIYAMDAVGNKATYVVPTQSIKASEMVIKNVKVSNSAGKYTVSATINGGYGGIDKVMFPTWSNANGQDDLVWGIGNVVGNTVTYTVDMKDHRYESGPYTTHIYAYDKFGKVKTYAVPMQSIKNNAPVIKNAAIKESGAGTYTVECEVSDDYGVASISFATWTTYNGQDDLIWQSAPVTNGKATLTVFASDHYYESGEYNTHIYAYDTAGLMVSSALVANMQAPNMQSGWKFLNGQKYLFDQNGNVVNGANKLIIDISEHNGDIDWVKVKSSGVDGVILRCGYGWSNNLSDQRDARFIKNAEELERLGIPYGVYLFSYENSVSGAVAEAEYTLKLIQGRKISLPVYYDLEYSNYVGDVSQNVYVQMAKAYCDRIALAGYTPGIYANLNYWNTKLNDSSLDQYTKWVAQYNSNNGQAGHCDYLKPYKMWQYTSVGSVTGINGNVDMNALFK